MAPDPTALMCARAVYDYDVAHKWFYEIGGHDPDTGEWLRLIVSPARYDYPAEARQAGYAELERVRPVYRKWYPVQLAAQRGTA